MKRAYEIALLLRIMSTPDETQAALNQIISWIEGPEDDPTGKVNRVDRTTLGRRKLAYEIDGQRDGLYVIVKADVDPAHMSELELNMKLYSPLLRHIVIRDEDEDRRRAEAEKAEAEDTADTESADSDDDETTTEDNQDQEETAEAAE